MQRKPPIGNPNNNLDDFINGAKDVKASAAIVNNQIKDEKDYDKLKRQTYYISELYIEAVNQMAFFEKMDKSEIVRTALEKYIPERYITQAIEALKK